MEPFSVAFVSAPGSSVFMDEILGAVADAVQRAGLPGVEVVRHHGLVSDVVDRGTVAVVAPHEYAAVAPPEPRKLLARTVAFGVEHPGTEEFESAAAEAAKLGAVFEISPSSAQELRRRGIEATHFPLGYVAAWDRWHRSPGERPVDLVYLGTADPRRLALLAGAAEPLAGLRTELMIPPHEPMTRPRPDFVVGEHKWRLLARSKVLLNLHRGEKTALEWVRVLEAMVNGCVVVTEPAEDLGPLQPDEHLVVAEPGEVGKVAAELIGDPERRDRIAAAAYDLVRGLDMTAAAGQLVAVCRGLLAAPAPEHPEPVSRPATVQAGMAGWLPAPRGGDWAQRPPVPRIELPRPAAGATDDRLGVLVARLPGDPAALPEVPGATVHVVTADPADGRRALWRNRLLAATDEPYVAVLDAGDQPIGAALGDLRDRLHEDPGLDAALCMATYGDTLVNVLVPEERRLRDRVYLTRGYVVRRSTLEALGGWDEDPEVGDLLDHEFWRTLTGSGGRTTMVRRIGVALCPR